MVLFNVFLSFEFLGIHINLKQMLSLEAIPLMHSSSAFSQSKVDLTKYCAFSWIDLETYIGNKALLLFFQMNLPVICKSLESDLAQLELIGLTSFQLIQKILHPVIR